MLTKSVTRNWIFLPRRASQTVPYTPDGDERQGTNLLIIVNEEFTEAKVKTIGPFDPLWGFSSVKLIPDTMELMALKVYEVDKETKTTITIFDLEGNFKLQPAWLNVSDAYKYEGLEFVSTGMH